MIFYKRLLIGVILVFMVLHFAKSDGFTIQKAVAAEEKKVVQQKISQHNECRNNGTSCADVASNDISISSLKSSTPSEKNDIGKQGISDTRPSQTDTPLLLPFP